VPYQITFSPPLPSIFFQSSPLALSNAPPGHLTESQLLADVASFAEQYHLTALLPDLKRAALVAQNILIYDSVARGIHPGTNLPVELSLEEKTALQNERDTLFAQSTGFYFTILTVCLAGVLQGWVQSSINSATLFFPAAYGLNESSNSDWIIGITNATTFLFSAVLGCPLVYPLNRWVGRRGAIRIAAVLIFASSLGCAFAQSWIQLSAYRIFNGVGMGLKAASTPILASESAVAFWRGSAALCWQLWVAFGIMLGFAANLVLSLAGNAIGWRLQLAAPMVPAFVLMIAIHWCPESPRWHMVNGEPKDYRKAYEVFKKLRNTKLQALRDLYLVHKQIELDNYSRRSYDIVSHHHWGSRNRGLVANTRDYISRFTQLFSSKHKRLQNAVLAACTVNLAQQLCGINVLAFYSGSLFSHASSGDQTARNHAALLYSLGFGALNFLFGLPAIRNIDTLGRRTLLLATLPLMSISLLAAGLCFYIPAEQTAHIGFIAFFLFVFAALYSPGLGPIPFTLASEVFPLSHREIGAAVSIGLNLFFAGVLTIFYPRLNSALGDTNSLCLFAGFNIIAASMIFLWVPETKQRSLEELDLVFAVPVVKFMEYQIKNVVPWAVKRFLLGRREGLIDLYVDRIWGSQCTDEEVEMPVMRLDREGVVAGTEQQGIIDAPIDDIEEQEQEEIERDSLSTHG
jgi:MFS family permease